MWRVVTGEKVLATSATDAEKDLYYVASDKAAGELSLWIEDGQKTHIKGVEGDPKKIWENLAAAHTSKRPIVRFNAYDDFFSLRKKADQTLSQIATQVEEAMQRIQSLRPTTFTLELLDEELIVMAMIRAIAGDEYQSFVSSLLLLDKLEKATVLEAFRNEQTQRMRRNDGQPAESVMAAQKETRLNVECFYCTIKGHKLEKCWRFLRDKKLVIEEIRKGRSSKPKATAAEESAGNASLRSSLPSDPMVAIQPDADLHWTADSGASSHMTPHRKWLHNYQPYRVPIRLADHTIVYSEGVGDVVFRPVIRGKSVRGVMFTRVLHVPDLRQNLLAVLFLTRRRNYHVHINGDSMSFQHGGEIVFVASINDNNIAHLDGTTDVTEQAHFTATVPLDFTLWHRRLGHHNLDGVKRLVNHNLVTGMIITSKSKPDPVCEPCIAGKMHANPFPLSSNHATRPLELVHSDLHGPLKVQSPSGYLYWDTFIDDYSDWWALRPLRKKSDNFAAFKQYKAWAENKTGYKIGAFQDDKAGDYMSAEYEQFCADEGIERRHTTRNRPQQNGHSERANRTISDNVTAMLYEAGLPQSFALEAAGAFIHVRNRCSTSNVPTSTPHERFLNKKPDISYFRVWGCLAYVHIQKDKRVGLSPHMQKCIFIGYPEGYKGWKFYNPTTKKVIISERADFDERCFPGLKMSTTRTAPPPPSSYPSLFDEDDSVPRPPSPPPPPPAPAPAAPVIPELPIVPPIDADDDHGGDNDSDDLNLRSRSPSVSPPRPPRSPLRPAPTPPLAQRRPQRNIRPPADWRIPLAPEGRDRSPSPPPSPSPLPSESSGPEFDGYDQVGLADDEHAYVALGNEPRSIHEARKRPDGDRWMDAASDEIAGHLRNGTWEVVKLPPGKKVIGSSFTFLVKRKADGAIDRYKARLVANGNMQVPDIDFKEVFSPTYRQAAIRLIMAIAAVEDLELRSVDISQAFLNGDLKEEIYMKQPQGFEVGGPEYVCRLLKAIYGLCQASRCWNQKIHTVLISMGFKRLDSDRSIYLYFRDGVRIIFPIYVDDITLASKSTQKINEVVTELSKHFKLHDLGETDSLLGVHITRDRPNRTIHLSQRQYIVDLLERHGMADCSPVTTPMVPNSSLTKAMCPVTPEDINTMKSHPYINIVGAIMYLAFFTRPDIAFTAVVLARFMSNPGLEHWNALKHLLRYLQGTKDLKLTYKPDDSKELFVSYCDADHGGNKDNGKSTGGYLMRYAGGAISWSSKLQPFVALSTTEAEYVSACEAGKEILWLRSILREFGYKIDSPSILRIDNQSALTVSKNPEHHGRMKHLDLRYFWLRDTVEMGHITPIYVPTSEMPADLLTKPLARALVEKFRAVMGLSS